MSERIKPISQGKATVNRVSSGDQSLFSSWDSIFKLSGYRKNGGSAPVDHQFHLADGFGKRNDNGTGFSLTNEAYRYRDGKEIQPAWFAITEQWPVFPVLSTVPYRIGSLIGERFESFAGDSAQALSSLPDEEKTAVEAAMEALGYAPRVPSNTDDIYELLTASSSYGIADEGRRSGTDYNFAEIETVQWRSMQRLYAETAALLPAGGKKGLKARFKDIIDPQGEYYPLIKDKPFSQAAEALFLHIAAKVEEISSVATGEITSEDTSAYFQLISAEGETNGNPDAFLFLDWYLQNRELYTMAHNEVSDEISQKGGNPIHSVSAQRGETPFWVIVAGEKHKLFLQEKEVIISKRNGNETEETVLSVRTLPTTHEALGALLATEYKGKAVTVIPTAIGLALHFRAGGDLLLPEHGSNYIPQVNRVYERLLLLANRAQTETLLPQNDIIRVHPHAIAALPDGRLLRLPWHLRDAFPVDREGFTTTDEIKTSWQTVVKERRQTIDHVKEAGSTFEKARILFQEGEAALIDNIVYRLEGISEKEAAVKPATATFMDAFKAGLDKKDLKQLGAISAYIRGQKDEVPDNSLIVEKREEIEALRAQFQKIAALAEGKEADEQVLKFFVALRARQLDASVESLEYFDSRPSLLTTYLLFENEGVRDIVNGSEAYREETPKPIQKAWYVAEGNKIMVVLDKAGENSPTRKKIAQRIARNLSEDSFDTAMVLTPTDNPEADFRMNQVCLDASVGGMCGNGVRSAARFAHEQWGMERVRLVTETGEIVEGFFDGEHYGAVLQATPLSRETVNQFGGLLTDEAIVAVTEETGLKEQIQQAIDTVAYEQEAVTILSIASISGEPHVVLSVPYLDFIPLNELTEIATAINKTGTFPQETNVTFVTQDGKEFYIATHERGGPGITGACATGAVSAMSVLKEYGHTDVTFRTPEGHLRVEHDGTSYIVRGEVAGAL